ncbi:anti-sigma factor family protein [Mycolicibacter minnesotensis]
MWDAAYVLGSLSAADRREFEAHLTGCLECNSAVAKLSGVPALLSQLDGAGVAAGSTDTEELRPPAELLPALLTEMRRRRRRTRLWSWAVTAAAAAFVVVGVLIGTGALTHTSAPPAEAVSMEQVGTTALASTIAVKSESWGSFIDLSCVCLAPLNAHHDTLALVVVGRDGSQTRVGTWVAEPGRTARPAGSISIPTDQIAAVHVVSADNGKVLLRHTL